MVLLSSCCSGPYKHTYRKKLSYTSRASCFLRSGPLSTSEFSAHDQRNKHSSLAPSSLPEPTVSGWIVTKQQQNDALFSNDTGILGKRNSEFSQQESNLRPSDY